MKLYRDFGVNSTVDGGPVNLYHATVVFWGTPVKPVDSRQKQHVVEARHLVGCFCWWVILLSSL